MALVVDSGRGLAAAALCVSSRGERTRAMNCCVDGVQCVPAEELVEEEEDFDGLKFFRVSWGHITSTA